MRCLLWCLAFAGFAAGPVIAAEHVLAPRLHHLRNGDRPEWSDFPPSAEAAAMDMRWVAKESLFKQPLSGWAMRLGGVIPLRRGEGDSVRACLAECERAIRGGISVMMFPEGTRSADAGSCHP